jgi:ribonuclease-3
MGLPEYELVNVTGKAHRQRFEVSCSVEEGARTTAGNGTTRRKAEQQAAERMLALLAGDAAP